MELNFILANTEIFLLLIFVTKLAYLKKLNLTIPEYRCVLFTVLVSYPSGIWLEIPPADWLLGFLFSLTFLGNPGAIPK